MSVDCYGTNARDSKDSYFPDMDFDRFRDRITHSENGKIDMESIFFNDLYSTTHSDNLGEFFCKLYQLSAKDGKLYLCPLVKLYNKDVGYDGTQITLGEKVTSDIKHLLNIDEFRFSSVDVDVIERKIIINLDTRPIMYSSFSSGGSIRTLPDGKLECCEDGQWFPFDHKTMTAIRPDVEQNLKDFFS